MSVEKIHQRIGELAPELFAVSDYLHANPELGHQEFKAQERLVGAFEAYGFHVERGTGGFETAFRAYLPEKKEGPTIAFIAEYDALPEIGHACGHNLICTAALGAAAALKTMAAELPGNITVVGTPGEEVPPGTKRLMIDRGVFDDVDVAMIAHGNDRTHVGGKLLATQKMLFRYRGQSSHAAMNPEKGISALDAAYLATHGIEMLREHVRSDVRIHGIITDGGRAPNVVPERAELAYMARAADRPYLKEVVERVKNCARAGALATGAELEIVDEGWTDSRLNVDELNDLLLQHAKMAGAQRILPPPEGLGSADFGNLTHALPAATLYVELVPEGTSLHTRAVTDAAGDEPGQNAILIGARAMASTAYDLLTQPALLDQVRDSFATVKDLEK